MAWKLTLEHPACSAVVDVLNEDWTMALDVQDRLTASGRTFHYRMTQAALRWLSENGYIQRRLPVKGGSRAFYRRVAA